MNLTKILFELHSEHAADSLVNRQMVQFTLQIIIFILLCSLFLVIPGLCVFFTFVALNDKNQKKNNMRCNILQV